MNDLAPPPARREAVFPTLGALLGERFSSAAAVRERHGKDGSYHTLRPPDAVGGELAAGGDRS